MPLSRCRTRYVLWAMMAALHPAAHAAGSPTTADEQHIAQWIKELGADAFAVREKASKHLRQAGEVAETALEKALYCGDAEIVRRAQAILDTFRWGIYPDTSDKVRALIKDYQRVDPEDESFQDEIVNNLFDSGWVGLRALLQIAKNDKACYRRNGLRDFASRRVLHYLHKMYVEVDDKNRCDRFFALACDGGCIGHNHFAAYCLLRGQLDETIRRYQRRRNHDASDQLSAYVLAYLYRVKGDLAAARTIAEKEKFDDLLIDIYLRTADWKALAARPKPMGVYPIDQACYRASFARLSGNHKQWEAAQSDLKKLAHGQDVHRAALTLILNDQPEDAIRLLAKSEQRKDLAFLVLCTRLQYREAMALVHRTSVDDPGRPDLEMAQASGWYRLGEQDKGHALLARLGEKIKEWRNDFWSQELLRTEHRLGADDLALEHCARVLPLPKAKGRWSPRDIDFLSEVFRSQGDYEVWYRLLRRKFPREPILDVLRRIDDLFKGKISQVTVRGWIEEEQKNLDSLKVEERRRQLMALAEAAHKAGLEPLARSLLQKADNDEAWMRLGDLATQKHEWRRAAAWYERAARRPFSDDDTPEEQLPDDPLALYLAGDALVKAGREQEGKRWMERAHFLPLGSASSRRNFVDGLWQRGHREAAQRELDLLTSLVDAPSNEFPWFSHHRARTAAARKNYFQSATAYQQTLFSDLGTAGAEFGLVGAMRMTSEIHRLHACGLLAAGKMEEARQEIDLALSAWPANVQIAVALVPELERRGHQKDADALFRRCCEQHEKVCRDYPRCAASHNSIAWISVCCRRNLDVALQHAEKAVALAPTNAGYLNTLAEVHFQCGDKEKAIAVQKRALELDPKKTYYRKQLKRIEAGDPKAERPSESEA